MKEICYTLITDGSSDRALMPILTWLLRELGVNYPIQEQWADLRRLRHPPKKLDEKISTSCNLYKCDLLFVHHDAENQPLKNRFDEIRDAAKTIAESIPPIVCVIPIRMTESWLLFDEKAIRRAAGNPNGNLKLDLPNISVIEKIPDSKEVLKELLNRASGNSRRRQEDNIPITRVAEIIDDFEPLRKLSAFQELEKELKTTLNEYFPDLLI